MSKANRPSNRWKIAVRAKALLFAGLLPAASCLAFAPGGGVHFYPGTKTHADITEEALASVYTSAGLPTITKSMKDARTQFVDANKAVDNNQEASALHFDAENFAGGQTLINLALDLAVAQVKSGNFSGARGSVGAALHTVQDFYAHSNWVELGNTVPSAELGRPTPITNTAGLKEPTCAKVAATCNVSNLIGTRLTSGYYGGEDLTIQAEGRTGKCRHGGYFDLGPEQDGSTNTWFIDVHFRQALSGINKDSGTCIGGGYRILDSPHSDFNPSAKTLAVKATIQVFDDLKPRMTASEFRSLLGVGPSLGFAIDTTGSMGNIIASVRADAIANVNARLGTDQEPSKYVLSPFNDPTVGPALSTADASAFKTAISGLTASGGGDCPELSMAGTYAAVDLSDNGGNVFVYTDASSKDAALSATVDALASTKKIKVFNALSGSCSPYDPAYFNVSNASGGQVFLLGTSEAGTLTKLSDVLASNNAVDIENRQGSISGTAATIPFFVDSSTTKLNVSFSSIDTTALTLIRPDGVTVTAATPGVTTIALSKGTVYTIASPQFGTWKAIVGGAGQYSLLVNGDSALALDDFRFVEVAGRDGHQGYFPIAGLPLLGKTYKAIARVSGAFNALAFEMRDLNGAVIKTLTLSDADVDDNYLAGDVLVPDQSFRVYATGTDKGGTFFQRLIATVIFPQSVVVNPPAAVNFGQGQTSTYIFEVRNEGPTGTFVFAAKDTGGFVSGAMVPSSATLAPGASVLTKATLRVGSTARIGTQDALTVTATNVTNPDIRNFAVLTSTVVAPKLVGDVNLDGVVNCADLKLIKASFGSKTGNRSFNPNVDLDSNGVIDVRDLAIVARLVPAGTLCV